MSCLRLAAQKYVRTVPSGYININNVASPSRDSVSLCLRQFGNLHAKRYMGHGQQYANPIGVQLGGRQLGQWDHSHTSFIRTRYYSSGRQGYNQNNATGYYAATVTVVFLAASYAAVPLYRAFCQATGYGGTTQENKDTDMRNMSKHMDRPIRIRFNADTSNNMQWNFRPQQREVTLVPGESVLAFYTATNPTDKPITGISTYNVIPFEAGQYFNKIQCFCFEEQRLNPDEQVDMPVFFYIDPEFAEDPFMAKVNTITLSYTFFESKSFDYGKWSASQPGPVVIPTHAQPKPTPESTPEHADATVPSPETVAS
eukprot:CFRG6598T1